MPDIETDELNQTAILWPIEGRDAYGEPVKGAPVELSVRWETKNAVMTDSMGNTIGLQAVVVVAQEVETGSQMWLGTLDDFLGTGSLGNETEIMHVAVYNETPDIRNRAIRRTLGLTRFRDQLPS